MDIDKTNEENFFADRIMDDKRDDSGDMTIKEIKEEFYDDKRSNCEEMSAQTKIKEEFFDSCDGDDFGSTYQERMVDGSSEVKPQDSSFKEKVFVEILKKEEIKEEFLEDQSPLDDEIGERFNFQNASTETLLPDSLINKMEHPPSNGMEVGLLQTNSEEYVSNKRGKLNTKLKTFDKPFKCSSCAYQAVSMSKLEQHIRTHSGEKPFKCSFCPYQAAQMGNIKRHERTHTGEKPFKCSSCSFQSADRTHLQWHIRTHTGDKPYQCRSCPYQAAAMATVKNHERTHTGEKPFKCTSCPYQATQMWNLKRHKRIHTRKA